MTQDIRLVTVSEDEKNYKVCGVTIQMLGFFGILNQNFVEMMKRRCGRGH